jgi:hypothetical protein
MGGKEVEEAGHGFFHPETLFITSSTDDQQYSQYLTSLPSRSRTSQYQAHAASLHA